MAGFKYSGFKPTQGEDYLSNSTFGNLAGSILGRKDKDAKKEFWKAVAGQVGISTIGALQKKQKQTLADGVEDVNENFADIFKNNEALFTTQKRNRADYQLYKDDPDRYTHAKAVEMFNSDPDIIKELGLNAFSSVNQETLTPESYKNAQAVYDSFKDKADYDIKQKGLNPAVNLPTFTQFNEKAMTAFKAALSEVQDDPTKKGLVIEAWNKLFGTARDGTKRFGMVEKAKLSLDSKNAKIAMTQQDSLVTESMSLKEQEDRTYTETSNINSEANSKVLNFYGTSIPSNFNFQTNKEMLKINKEAFAKKVNVSSYTITSDDISSAVEFGYAIPGFTGLKNVMAEDRKLLAATAAKVQINSKLGMDPWDDGVLNSSERRVWAMATSQDLNARQVSDMSLEEAKRKMKALVPVDYAKVVSYMKDTITAPTTQAAFLSAVEKIPALEEIYKNNISERTKETVNSHVIEGALYLQTQNKGLSLGDAVRMAIPLQMAGFYEFQDDPWFSDVTHAHEYVDANVLKHMDRDTLTQKDADLSTFYMNNHRYVQNLNGGELVPRSTSKSIPDGDYEFSVINTKDEDAPEGTPDSFEWINKYIGN